MKTFMCFVKIVHRFLSTLSCTFASAWLDFAIGSRTDLRDARLALGLSEEDLESTAPEGIQANKEEKAI